MENLERGVIELILILEISSLKFSVMTSSDFSIEPQVLDSHLVLSQGSSLIRADARGRSQGFDGFEILDQDLSVGKSFSGDSEGNGDTGKQTFRDVSDQNSDSEDDALQSAVVDDQKSEQKENDSQGDSDDGNDQHESVQFGSQRRLGDSTSGSEIGDLTHDSLFSNTDNDSSASTFLTHGSEKGKIFGFERFLRVGAFH